jgi:predicted metal-binding membrane protein
MKTATIIIIAIAISISALTWLVSIWQYDAMMSSMMMFHNSLAALSLFVVIWTAGMAAMMFPAIIPMILVYNRLIGSNNTSRNSGNSNHNSQMIYHKSNDDHNENVNNEIRHTVKEGRGKSTIRSLRYTFQARSFNIMAFVSSYLAIWALTGIILLVGWSFLFDTLLLQLGINDSLQTRQQQQQQLSINTIYAIVLIISGIYQFSPLKTRCLGYCESPLSFFMRRWRKGMVGAVKMGAYHGLYCLGCCWPYFLLMVALGWMNLLWMGLFAAIIFAEKIWSKGGLWIARITGACFITIGILSWAGIISLPFNAMNNVEGNRMSMDMPASQSHDMTMSHNLIIKNSSNSEQGVDKSNNANSKNNAMNGMVMKMIMVVITTYRAF